MANIPKRVVRSKMGASLPFSLESQDGRLGHLRQLINDAVRTSRKRTDRSDRTGSTEIGFGVLQHEYCGRTAAQSRIKKELVRKPPDYIIEIICIGAPLLH